MNQTRKDHIIDKATELFMEKGIVATSMDDIAVSVPAAKMTIYKYFGSKDNLVSEVLGRYIKGLHAGMSAIIAESPDPLAAIVSIMSYRDLQIPENFMKECIELYPQLSTQLMDYYRHNIAGEFERLIFEGQRSGHIRKDVSPHILMTYIEAIKSHLSRPEMVSRMSNFKAIGEQFRTIFLHGIVNPDAHKKGDSE